MTLPLSITASSACSALGPNVAALEAALATGRSGLLATGPDLPFTTFVGAVTSELAALPPELQPFDTRLARLVSHLLAAIAPEVSRARARWGDARVGVFLGTSNAGILQTEDADAVRVRTGALPASARAR